MKIQKQLTEKIKEAMKSKDVLALKALRALKSAFMLVNTERGDAELSDEEELKIVQKQVKQRKDSALIFSDQGRDDLAEPELAEASVLEQFLPKALSKEEIEEVVNDIIRDIKAEGIKDMGKVMGVASKKLVGKADGKIISTIVKSKLVK
ncbi:GatB/YqeY domain-containing protein [Tenacibaculum sp. C7A-26P2]|uniref:GatB/YqeY domain-containing protein n=1 Tax=Tenacibaculum sp. C7A-26P2 TaxID=3447504 RepID=UPI003F860F35